MQVIPVLDLLDGHAVRAVRGERERYRPIESSLCATSEPLGVARALLAATGARTLYIADLGAILKRNDHAAHITALLDALDIEIWLDAGYTDFASMRTLFDRIDTARSKLVPIFGTETLVNADALREAQSAGFEPVLSLDHRAGRLMADPAAACSDISWWPSRVIVMTLDQVGAYQGPDLATIDAVRAQAGDCELIGAGGIRDDADLSAAARSGASAWLVASAIHDRRVSLQRWIEPE
ncbi:HisA/HisF-related TIM barrel protein [Caballeronia sp. dw_276]|jgi:phosphoribosylformimino-5-aminoimidazole carboxamide ribotide isomerase|uniref:HisA/HisF-related TIM barrel protein n=1 Tax=Caballeronia sp. dw_276 TaxID=2719795 RepID=UPI001BD6B1CA|nr:HisA/HisF-related TIM barrel protein [Caballeronia sp. dw_276]